MANKEYQLHIYNELMITVRNKMRMFGVTLSDVAKDCKLGVSDVCRLLNDDLVVSVKSSANKLVSEKQEQLNQVGNIDRKRI